MAKLAIPTSEFDQDSVVAGSAKKALESVSAARTEMYLADIDTLALIPGFNVRIETPDYTAHVENIAQSIFANGYYPNKPLGGFAGKQDGKDVIFVTDGHSRLRAIHRAKELGAELTKVPVVLKAAGTSLEDLTVALVQDNEGRPLSYMEKAIVAVRLIGFGMEKAEVAKRFTVTEKTIEDFQVLAAAPPKVRALVANGKVSATEAVKQVRKNPEKAATVLGAAVDTATSEGKTKATGKHVAKASGSSKAAGTTPATEKAVYRFKAGETYPATEIKPISRVEDGAWWEFADDSKETVRALETLTITVLVEKPAAASDDDLENVTAPAAAPKPKKAAAKGKGKKTAKAAAKGKTAKVKKAAAPAADVPATDPDLEPTTEDHGL